jgi:hypothetical protein
MKTSPSATWRKVRRRLRRHGYTRAAIHREVWPHDGIDGHNVVYRGCVYDARGELVQGCKLKTRRRARRALACGAWFFERFPNLPELPEVPW